MTEEEQKRWHLSDGDSLIVCDACLRAGCWAGVFLCEDGMTAKTRTITVGESRALDVETDEGRKELRRAEGLG